MPLVSRGRAVGTLNVVSRQPHAFGQAHVDALQPIAEILAVAWVAQQLHMTLGRHRTMEVMSELTLSVAAEINSALQTIIGHCDLIGRTQHDAALQRDLQTIMGQAQRIDGLLDKMRTAARERLREMTHTINQEGIPTSPEVPAEEVDVKSDRREVGSGSEVDQGRARGLEFIQTIFSLVPVPFSHDFHDFVSFFPVIPRAAAPTTPSPTAPQSPPA